MNTILPKQLIALQPVWSESALIQAGPTTEVTIENIVTAATAAHLGWLKIAKGLKKAVVKFHRHSTSTSGTDLVARGGFAQLNESTYNQQTKRPSFIFAHGEEIEITGVKNIIDFRFKAHEDAAKCWVSILLFK